MVVVEGFFDCVRVHEAGFAAVALMGSELSERQRELLALFEKVTLMLDGDAAGTKAAGEIATRLVRQQYVRVVEVPQKRQPDELLHKEIRGLLNAA